MKSFSTPFIHFVWLSQKINHIRAKKQFSLLYLYLKWKHGRDAVTSGG